MKGIWFWPPDAREQAKILKKVAASESMLTILTALSKSKDGLSNAQIDSVTSSYSQWNSLWAIRPLLSLGFVEYKTEWFGDAGKYVLTELGKDVLVRLTGKPRQVVAQVPAPKLPA